MAGNELPGVLGADAPLEGGFREIAELPDDAQEEADEQRVPRAEPRKEPALGRERGQRRPHELGQRALDRLAGADAGRQLVPARWNIRENSQLARIPTATIMRSKARGTPPSTIQMNRGRRTTVDSVRLASPLHREVVGRSSGVGSGMPCAPGIKPARSGGRAAGNRPRPDTGRAARSPASEWASPRAPCRRSARAGSSTAASRRSCG